MAFDLASLEAAVMAHPAHMAAPLPDWLTAPDFSASEAGSGISAPVPLSNGEILSEAAFLDLWGQMHDIGGGIVQARTGAECALGAQARSEGGQVAGKALYAMCEAHPGLRRMVLSVEGTFLGQIAAIGMHGFACVQIVRAAYAAPVNDNSAPVVQFKTQRGPGDGV